MSRGRRVIAQRNRESRNTAMVKSETTRHNAAHGEKLSAVPGHEGARYGRYLETPQSHVPAPEVQSPAPSELDGTHMQAADPADRSSIRNRAGW
jgi:hypothetical protein